MATSKKNEEEMKLLGLRPLAKRSWEDTFTLPDLGEVNLIPTSFLLILTSQYLASVKQTFYFKNFCFCRDKKLLCQKF